MDIVHCTLYAVQCRLYSVGCILYTAAHCCSVQMYKTDATRKDSKRRRNLPTSKIDEEGIYIFEKVGQPIQTLQCIPWALV